MSDNDKLSSENDRGKFVMSENESAAIPTSSENDRDCAEDEQTRGQTNTDNPAEYGYIRKRIVPLGMKRISI